MTSRTSVSAALTLSVLVGLLSSCDTNFDRETGGGPTDPGQGPGTVSPPVLTRIDGTNEEPVTPGQLITLVGLNFSSELGNNEVFFTAGNKRVRGLPVRVVAESTGEGENLQSLLDVIVPGGVSRGNVELVVNGQSAGAAGLDVEPQLYAYTLGANQSAAFLVYTPLGFVDGASRINLVGVSLSDVIEAIVSDDTGNNRRIPSSTFIRNPAAPSQQAQEPTGYESVAFNLRDDDNDVRLPFAGDRGNLGVVLRGSSGESNRLEVPVTTDQGIDEIGFVISGVRVPPGVVTGPVRIEFTCYELAVNAAWDMNVEFRASNEQFTSEWMVAKPVEPTPELTGSVNIIAGTSSHRSGHRLLPGIGDVRTFIWDAPNDPNFRLVNEERGTDGLSRPRYWRVEFRLTPQPDTANRSLIGHEVVTPPIVYYDLVDRPSDSAAAERVGIVFETFDNVVGRDSRLTTANWGPPNNPGLLSGSTQDTDNPRFGEGRAILELRNVNPEEFLDPGEMIVDEFIEFDTDRMEVVHHVFVTLAADPTLIIEEAFVEGYFDADGAPVDNPGEEIDEFHLAALRISAGTRVFGLGAVPLVIRLSGIGVDEGQPAFLVEGGETPALLDLSGARGFDSEPPFPDGNCPVPPNCGELNGLGGRGGSGGGRGGNGGQVRIGFATPIVDLLVNAEDGFNSGGTYGGTPAAVHFDQSTTTSFFHGAPGGGAGHRLPGGDGNYGRKSIAQYQDPKIGRGGGIRGSSEQLPLTAGAGGGGGGGSVWKAESPMAANGPFYTAPGAGGGGGGGALQVVVDGDVVIEGRILSNGGEGGFAWRPRHEPSPPEPDYPPANLSVTGGAGGGGSGGSIVIQASGSIDIADCSSLEVNGGAGGTSERGGDQAGGVGAPGYIRLETAGAPLPFCGQVPGGEALSGGGLVETDDPIVFGRGQDGNLHLRFVPALNPLTNEPVIDPDTGRPTSVWTYNTDEGVLRNPANQTFKNRIPGRFDLARLLIDENVVLRVSGTRHFEISVRDTAEIAGAIDVSGFNGQPLQFSAPGTNPLPGAGGAGGPGAGPGGDGGTIQFVDGNASNRRSDNTIPISGGDGGVPPGTEGFNVVGGFDPGGGTDDILPPRFAGATGGNSLGGRGADSEGGCDAACQDQIDNTSAGGGGGAGHRAPGEDGSATQLVPDPEALEQLIGQGGSVFGFNDLRLDGELFVFGGPGGAGGGASANPSSAYSSRAISGRYAFPGRALYAPGTGGGGGGGFLHIKAASLILRSTARLLSRGGNAYQSIDLGGNGAAGAGGVILVQVTQTLNVEAGASIDVSGGRANLLPPLTPEGLTSYEGNIRSSFRGSAPASEGTAFGGLGGAGAPGRVRFEAPAGSGLAMLGENLSVSTGVFATDVTESMAFSLPIQLGLGRGQVASSIDVDLTSPRVVFSPLQPPGTEVVVLWEGARDSLDIHGEVGTLRQRVRDPRQLLEKEFVRFSVVFLSNVLTRNSQAIQEIRLPYQFVPSE